MAADRIVVIFKHRLGTADQRQFLKKCSSVVKVRKTAWHDDSEATIAFNGDPEVFRVLLESEECVESTREERP